VAILLQVVVTGLAAGAVYGVVAVSLSLIYRLTGVVHFALGELISLSVFASLFFAAGTRPVARTGVPVGRFVPAVVGGLLVAVAAGFLVYAVAVGPFLRRGKTLGWIGGVVAVAFAVRGFLAASFVRPGYVFPDPIPFHRLPNEGLIRMSGGVVLQVRSFFVAGVGVGLAALAAWVLRRTRAGTALRAIAEDPDGARLIGLPTERLLGVAFAAAGALAALAALVAAPSAPVAADTGALMGLKGLVAALFAGFGSPWNALAAGLAVGLVESGVSSLHVGPVQLGPQYRDILPLALAMVALFLARRRSQVLAE
jgi:branched-subunit amino acid ABC-type transport system permease component